MRNALLGLTLVVSIAGVTGIASAALQQASQVFHVRLTRVPFNVPNTTIAGEGDGDGDARGFDADHQRHIFRPEVSRHCGEAL